LTAEQLLGAFSKMVTIRAFEETVWDLYRRGEMPGLAHLSIGQEAVAVGVCSAIRDDDYIVSTHRGHGHCIAKGTDLDFLMAEMLGKETGVCRGRGGTMHFADLAHHNIGAMGIVGAGVGLGCGLALSCAMAGNGRVVAAFCGDGAMNEGIVYETMNLAAVWRLPLIIVCEHNQYGEYTAAKSVTAGSRFAARAEAMGISVADVDGMSVSEVNEATKRAVAGARSGEGPFFLECETYRFSGHHVGDLERYRTKEEVATWRERDPIEQAALELERLAVADSELEAVRVQAAALVEAAVAFARNSSFPDPLELDAYVYAD
jgi:acetoin:2,6-dichlorophenolindophenol oxidoreductase subunit alpha